MNFPDGFVKSTKKSNLMQIRPVEAELFHADGRKDMTKLIVLFRKSEKAPKNDTGETKGKREFRTKSLFVRDFP